MMASAPCRIPAAPMPAMALPATKVDELAEAAQRIEPAFICKHGSRESITGEDILSKREIDAMYVVLILKSL